MTFTKEDRIKYEAATECHIWEKQYASLQTIVHAHKLGDNIDQCSECQINKLIESKTFTESIHHVHTQHQIEKNCKECKNNK